MTILAANLPQLENVTKDGGGLHFDVKTDWGINYGVEYTGSLAPPIAWQTLTNITGSGALMTFTDSTPPATNRFYRISIQ